MFRLYITPAEGDPFSEQGQHPKYFGALPGWRGFYYGFQPTYLIAADLTPAQDAAVIANTDVFAFPFDLTGTVGGGNVQNARTALEAALIPAQAINGQNTWLEVARLVAGMFQFMQRLRGITGPTTLIDTSAKLNVQWGSIPVDPWQTAILAAAASFGYDTTFIQNNTQLRTIIDNFGRQWGNKQFQFGEFVI